MIKLFFLKPLLLPFQAAMIILIACNISGCTNTTLPAPAAGTITLSNYLDTLFVDSSDFVKLDSTKRTVFEFRIGGFDSLTMGDTLTMDGWTAPLLTQNPFSDDPNIRLLKGSTDSSQTLGPGTYLGNQVFHKNQVKNIQDLLAFKHAPYVLFVPNKYKGHVYYDIYLGFDNPRAHPLIPFTTPPVNTNQSSNPSPPKSYTN